MKKISIIVSMLLFLSSMLILTVHIFPDIKTMAWSQSKLGMKIGLTEGYEGVKELSLGQVQPLEYQRMGMLSGMVLFSPDSRFLAVGTENGEVSLLSPEGKCLWTKKFGMGKISALEFSADSSRVFIGETSPEGALVCMDSQNGKEYWRMSSAKELGVVIQKKIFPGIIAITADKQDGIYAVGQRYEFTAKGDREYISKIYRIDQVTGVVRPFPLEKNIDAWVGSVSVDSRGEHLLFGTANFHEMDSLQYADHIYCLDNRDDSIAWSIRLDGVYPYPTVTIRQAPAISDDDQYIAAVTGDGRALFYNSGGILLWQRLICPPRKISDVYINASAIYSKIVDDRVLFFTANTSNRINTQLPTPIEHPSSCSLFLFDLAGNLITRYQAGGLIGNLAVTKEEIALSVGSNMQTKDSSKHGIAILSLTDGSQLDYLPMVGPCFRVAVSPNGLYIAGIEAPLKVESGAIIGEYQLHIWKKPS